MANLELIEPGTGGGDGRVAAAARKLASVIPVGFVVAGALTGATAATAPPSMLNWTSAGVHRLEHAPEWTSLKPTSESSALVLNAAQAVLARIKQDTGLTWGQIADAVNVDVRALHLWRKGGGISAVHETSLHDLDYLVQNVRLHEPSETRSELVSAPSGQSLLERLSQGASVRELAMAAPWRDEARDAVAHNVAARTAGQSVDEDFAFLLYATDADAAAFSERASALLDDPSTTRRGWESEFDRQFAEVEQPLVADVAATSDFSDDGGHGEDERPTATPLFGLDDLGITLGVGAIASRPALSQDR